MTRLLGRRPGTSARSVGTWCCISTFWRRIQHMYACVRSSPLFVPGAVAANASYQEVLLEVCSEETGLQQVRYCRDNRCIATGRR